MVDIKVKLSLQEYIIEVPSVKWSTLRSIGKTSQILKSYQGPSPHITLNQLDGAVINPCHGRSPTWIIKLLLTEAI